MEYEEYTETKQEFPADELEEEEEEGDGEATRIRRFRHYKPEAIMLQECEEYVKSGKRLPKLHSRWLLNHYVNAHSFTQASIPLHNRMVDELREAKGEVWKLRHRIEELEAEAGKKA